MSGFSGGGGAAVVPPFVGFRANKNAVDQTGVASATATKLTFTTEVFDNGSYYDNTNSKWTPPAGFVELNLCVYASAGVQSFIYAYIYKNGALLGRSAPFYHASDAGTQVSIDDQANGTDYYEGYVFLTTLTTGTIFGAITDTYFQGAALK